MYICLYIYKPMTKWLATWAKNPVAASSSAASYVQS